MDEKSRLPLKRNPDLRESMLGPQPALGPHLAPTYEAWVVLAQMAGFNGISLQDIQSYIAVYGWRDRQIEFANHIRAMEQASREYQHEKREDQKAKAEAKKKAEAEKKRGRS